MNPIYLSAVVLLLTLHHVQSIEIDAPMHPSSQRELKSGVLFSEAAETIGKHAKTFKSGFGKAAKKFNKHAKTVDLHAYIKYAQLREIIASMMGSKEGVQHWKKAVRNAKVKIMIKEGVNKVQGAVNGAVESIKKVFRGKKKN